MFTNALKKMLLVLFPANKLMQQWFWHLIIRSRSQTFDFEVHSFISDYRLLTFRLPAFGHSIPEFEVLFPTINVESFCFRLRTSNFRRKPSDFGHSISEFYFRPLTYNILTSGFRLQFSTNLLRPDLWRWTFKIGV